jgi:hypothetical protein
MGRWRPAVRAFRSPAVPQIRPCIPGYRTADGYRRTPYPRALQPRPRLPFEGQARLIEQDCGFTPRTVRFRQRAEAADAPLCARLHELAAACEAHVAQRGRRRGDGARTRLAANVHPLALNLYAAWRQDIVLAVAIPQGAPFPARRAVDHAEASSTTPVQISRMAATCCVPIGSPKAKWPISAIAT